MHRALLLIHLLGLGLALGGAAVKVSLLIGSRTDLLLASAYSRVAPTVTKLIVAGMALLTASGAAWILLLGHRVTPGVALKIALAALVWVLGHLIDKLVEPGFVRLLPAAGAPISAAYVQARRRYVALELVATGLLGATTVVGALL